MGFCKSLSKEKLGSAALVLLFVICNLLGSGNVSTEPQAIIEAYEESGYYIQVVEAQGYSTKEMIVLEVSIDMATDKVSTVSIISHGETADYGGYLTEDWFLERFIGQSVGQLLQVVQIMPEQEGDIVAITGATRTSEGVVEGVNVAMEHYKYEYKK